MSLMPLPEGNFLTPEQEAYLVSIYGPNSYPLAVQKSIGFTGNQAEVDAFAQQNPEAVAQYQTIPSQETGGGQRSQLPDWVVPPPPGSINNMMVGSVTNPYTGETVMVPSGGYSVNDEAARAAAENPQPTQPPAGQDRVGMPVTQLPATQDQVAPPQVSNEAPFVSGIARRDVSMDPIIQQLLFGDATQTGFLPGAFRAAERTFFDDQGRPIVIPQAIAGLTADQQLAADIARSQVGQQLPFLSAAEQAYGRGLAALTSGLDEQRDFARGALTDYSSELQEALGLGRRAAGRFGEDLGQIEGLAEQAERDLGRRVEDATGTLRGGVSTLEQQLDRALGREQAAIDDFSGDLGGSLAERRRAISGLQPGLGRSEQALRSAIGGLDRRLGASELGSARGVSDLGSRLSESEARLRATTGGFDPRMTGEFYDPFEQAVVQQTIEDVLEGADQADIAQRARDIQTGGESAFGSRARLTAEERREALGRGLADRISAIRSGGFQRAQQTALGEFARQQAAQRQAATGLASLAGQRFGAGEQLATRLGTGAQQRFGAGSRLADQIGQRAQLESGAGERMAGALSDAARQRLAAQQRFSSQIAGLAGQRFGAARDLTGQQMSAASAQQAASQARQATLGQTAAQRLASQQQLAQQQSNLANQRMAAQQNYSSMLGQQAQLRQGAQTQFGQQMTGLGQNVASAGAQDVANLQAIGGQQQTLNQAQLDAQRNALLQAQQAPMQQYQSLLPFVQLAGQQTGPSQIGTEFAPMPSALQAGLGAGLATLGALGNFFGQGQQAAIQQQALNQGQQALNIQAQQAGVPIQQQPQPQQTQFGQAMYYPGFTPIPQYNTNQPFRLPTPQQQQYGQYQV